MYFSRDMALWTAAAQHVPICTLDVHTYTYVATLSGDNLTWCSCWARPAGLVWARARGHWNFLLNNFRGSHRIRENSEN